MKFKDFIKDKKIEIILMLFSTMSIEIILLAYQIQLIVRVYVVASIILSLLISMLIEYYSKKSYYNNLLEKLDELDQKYLLSEVISKANFQDGNLFKEILEETGKSMLENVNKYKYAQEDYKEYIELWIHEIKTPISASKLIIENNKNEVTKNIEEELDKIENYTEQALYYARSNTVEKDYIITKTNLKDIINMSIIKNKTIILNNKIELDIHDLEKQVYTDSKWVVFILNQVIQNSIKYSKKENKLIEIYAEEQKEKVTLYIKDNGLGIKKSELSRVFEKGFTGENGRIIGKKSTGIGLYLCKKLCDKLQLAININAEQNVGTEVTIVFPKGSFSNFEN
jgi:signal transduction histidine kinase